MGLTTILVGFLCSMVTALALTRGAITLGTRAGIVDKPDGFRKKHGRDVPRVGGLAIFFAIVIPSAILVLFLSEIPMSAILTANINRILVCFAGAAMVTGLGLMDDIFDLNAALKFFVQIIISGFMYFMGFRIVAVINPLGGGDLFLGVLELPVTILWFLVCMNVVNLLDGIDGLAAGACLFVVVTLFFLSLNFHNHMGMFLLACMAGAILGFLFFNFPPARIFLGDSGSLLLGYLIAAFTLLCGIRKADAAVALLIPVVAMGLPLLDTVLAITRRWFRKVPLSSSDRMHIHHRLVEGLGYRKALVVLYAVCVGLLGAALLLIFGNNEMVLIVLVVLALLVFVCFRFFSGIKISDLLDRFSGEADLRGDYQDGRAMMYRILAMMQDASDNNAVWDLSEELFESLGLENVVLRTKDKSYVYEKKPLKKMSDDGSWVLDLPFRTGDGVSSRLVVTVRLDSDRSEVVDSEMMIILRDGLEKYLKG